MKIGLTLLLVFSQVAFSHGSVNAPEKHVLDEHSSKKQIFFPNTEEYLTISTDLHTHSVFSDGHVWPNIRVAEALKDGTDLIAITEHLEYQPHLLDIPNKDKNKAFVEAYQSVKNNELIVVNGVEITRDMPTGHINAVFIQDANKLFKKDESKKAEAEARVKEWLKNNSYESNPEVLNHAALTSLWPSEEAISEANKQRAFVFWNHPMWSDQTKDGIARLSDFHKELIDKKLLHGIEIVNGDSYSKEAFQIAIENKLTLIGTSDVHNLIEWDYIEKDSHRPVTLVFTNNKNKNSIKRALFQGRTVVWFKDSLIGLKQNLIPLLESCLSISSGKYLDDTNILSIEINNNSGASFVLKNSSSYSFQNYDDLISIDPKASIKLEIKTIEKLERLRLPFIVLNALETPKKNAEIILEYEVGK